MGLIKGLRPSYAGVTATLALVLALGMGGDDAAAAPAGAVTITVTKTGDGGKGSLRRAIAKAGPGDTVKVPKGTYGLNRGDLKVDDAIKVLGAGPERTIIDANGRSRVFLTSAVEPARIARLTVTGGAAGQGGGIQNLGRLVLRRVVVRGNFASEQLGGGSGGGIFSNNDLRLVGTTVVSNRSRGDAEATIGAGIFVTGTEGSDLTLVRSVISRNAAPNADGGGLMVGVSLQNSPANLTIRKSTIANNRASGGGFAPGLGYSAIAGGAVSSRVEITDSTISGNRGTGLTAFGGGFAFQPSANAAGSHFELSMANVTISGNSVGVPDERRGFGGGLFLSPSAGNGTVSMELNNLTVTGNRAVATGGGGGGGVYNQATGVPDPLIGNSVISGNVSGNGKDCLGPLDSHGHDLVGDSCNDFNQGGDQLGVNPRLGKLAANGGPTRTHALKAGSPAIGNADPALCPAKDQRGVRRPQGPVCDIGAFERRR